MPKIGVFLTFKKFVQNLTIDSYGVNKILIAFPSAWSKIACFASDRGIFFVISFVTSTCPSDIKSRACLKYCGGGKRL